MLGDMIKETLYIGLFTTPIFNPRKVSFACAKWKKKMIQLLKAFKNTWWNMRGGGRRLAVAWPRLRLPDLHNQHPFGEAHVPHLAEEQRSAVTAAHVRNT